MAEAADARIDQMRQSKISSRRCWLFHSWTRWRDLKSGTINAVDRNGSKREIGMTIFQERRCGCCNAVELRSASTTV